MRSPASRCPALVGALAILMCSCASGRALKAYDGPVRPDEQLAVLKRDPYVGNQYSTWIWSVDGFKEPEVNNMPEMSGEAKMPPGRHTVEGNVGKFGLSGMFHKKTVLLSPTPKKVVFTAEAGHEYMLKAAIDEPEFSLWIVDTETGKVVGGTKPPK